MKEMILDILVLWLALPTGAKIATVAAIVGGISWAIGSTLMWLWNKDDERTIGHTGRMKLLAKERGYQYFEEAPAPLVKQLSALPIFATGTKHAVSHVLHKQLGELETSVFFFTREQSSKNGWSGEFFTTVVSYRVSGASFPIFTMTPEPSEGQPGTMVVDEALARVYAIRARDDDREVRHFFTPGIVALFEKAQGWYVAFGGERITFWQPMRNQVEEPIHGVAHEVYDPIVAKMPIRELPGLIRETRRCLEVIAAAAGRAVETLEAKAARR